MTLGLGMQHWGCGVNQVCSNDDHRLTLTYLTSRSNLLHNAYKRESFGKIDFLKIVGSQSLFSLLMFNLINRTMAINNLNRSRLTFDFQPRSLILESHLYLKHSFLRNHQAK